MQLNLTGDAHIIPNMPSVSLFDQDFSSAGTPVDLFSQTRAENFRQEKFREETALKQRHM